MTPSAERKMRWLARALTPEDLRALAIELGLQNAERRQLPGIVDILVTEHHDALLDRLELRINEVAKEIAG